MVIFLNGEYYGIENLREKLNEHYIAANHDVKASNVNMIKTFKKPIVVSGDSIAYTSLIQFVENNDLSDDSIYTIASSKIDIENYIDYNITEVFCANHDWPGNNGKFWRLNVQSGKWRWIIVDMDYGFGIVGKYNFNTVDYIMTETGKAMNQPWSTLLFRSLMKNDEFRSQFLHRFSYHLNNTFTTGRVIKVIDSLKANLTPEMPAHINKWHNKNGIQSMSNWEDKIEVMREFARKRPTYLRQYISDVFELNDTCQFMKQTTHLVLPDEQMIYLNAGDPELKTVTIDELMSPQSNNIKFNIELMDYQTYAVTVMGWAILNDYSSENTTITVLLKSDKKTYALPTSVFARPDVTNHFKTLDYYASGFKVIISKLALEPGIYQLGFHIAKNGKIAAEKYTDQIIEVK